MESDINNHPRLPLDGFEQAELEFHTPAVVGELATRFVVPHDHMNPDGTEMEPVVGVSRIVGRNRMAHEIVQQVIGEMGRMRGTGRDDAVWWQLHEIEEENGLPYNITADDLYMLYRSNYGGES